MHIIEIIFQMMKVEEIKIFRDSRNLSLADMAVLLSKEISKEKPTKVSPSTISKWENGYSNPSATYVRALKKIMTYKEDHGYYTKTIKEEVGIDESRDITGKWLTKWWYQKNDNDVSRSDSLEIKHNGDIITGESSSNGNFKYRIIAHLMNDNIISGKWYSILRQSKNHGAFMINLKRNGKNGNGKWLGTYDDGPSSIMHGKWEWKKQ